MHKFFAIAILFLPLFLFSQSNYKESFVITEKGDTIKGFINYREWHQNPEKISFKEKMDDANAKTLTVENTKQFVILGYESYTQYTVPISMGDINPGNLKEQPDSTYITRTVFLKEIIKGDKIYLYSYKDAIKERFYVLDKDENSPRELIYRKSLKDMQEASQDIFKQQLLTLSVKYSALTPQLDKLIQRANYSKDELKKIVENINSKNEIAFSNVNEKGKKATFWIGAGINYNSVTYTGKNMVTVDRLDAAGNNKYQDEVITKGYSPRIIAAADFYINPSIQRLIIRTELTAAKIKSTVVSHYKYNNYSEAELEYTYRLSAWNISFAPQMILNFYNTPELKFYIGAGGAYNIVFEQENSLHKKDINQSTNNEETTENYFPLKKSNLRALVRAGTLLNQRFDLSFMWSNPIEYISLSQSSAKASQVSFSVAYALSK